MTGYRRLAALSLLAGCFCQTAARSRGRAAAYNTIAVVAGAAATVVGYELFVHADHGAFCCTGEEFGASLVMAPGVMAFGAGFGGLFVNALDLQPVQRR